MAKPIDIIMWVGEEHYTVGSFIREAEQMGVSKRIPRTAIPEGIVPGQSRILIKHRKAIVHGDLDGLLRKLDEAMYLSHVTLPEDMITLVVFLEVLQEKEFAIWQELVEGYNLTWTSGVIGYSYITSIQYIASDDEEELPEDLQHLEGYVEPVKIKYEEKDDVMEL